MRRIGIFGGSFNPPHLGHIRIAESAREQFALSEIRWIPAHAPPHKMGTSLAAATHRLQMTNLAVEDHPEFSVSDQEIARGGTSFTVETLRNLQREAPDAELFLIVGEDNYADFENWKEPEAILALAELIVYPKAKYDARTSQTYMKALYLDAHLLPMSSTLVRNSISRGESVEDLISPRVATYIKAHRLYLSG